MGLSSAGFYRNFFIDGNITGENDRIMLNHWLFLFFSHELLEGQIFQINSTPVPYSEILNRMLPNRWFVSARALFTELNSLSLFFFFAWDKNNVVYNWKSGTFQNLQNFIEDSAVSMKLEMCWNANQSSYSKFNDLLCRWWVIS